MRTQICILMVFLAGCSATTPYVPGKDSITYTNEVLAAMNIFNGYNEGLQSQEKDANGQSPNSYEDNQVHQTGQIPQQIDTKSRFLNTNENNQGNEGQQTDQQSQQTGSVCYTENQERGVCVKSTLCKRRRKKLNSNKPVFIYRMQDYESNPNDCEFLKMCCPINKLRTTPVPPPNRPIEKCGYSNAGAAVFREATGTSTSGYADFAEFPWMVALVKNEGGPWNDSMYLGGGTLIHRSVVMTAAHKVDTLRPQELKCRAGEWNTQNENEVFGHEERNVQRIIVNTEFDRLNSYNNIALLLMETPFTIQAHINVACLARSLPPPGTICYSMGWGMDFTRSEYNANILKKITLPLVAAQKCQSQLRRTNLEPDFVLHNTLTCAGGVRNVDTCIGDGGSSLVCPIGNPGDLRYAVIGMVAYGMECGGDNLPGVYVNVPRLVGWVDRQIDRLISGEDQKYSF